MDTSALTETEFADWDERASILEFEAGMTREEAEAEALRLILASRSTR